MTDEPKIVYDEDSGAEEGERVNEVNELIGKLRKLKKKLKVNRQEKEEYLAGWQRCQADLINYKRRQEEQMKEWQKLVNEELIRDLLPVLDSLEVGITKGKDSGLENIKKQLLEILKKHGLEEIRSVGEHFNPQFHEAVESVQTDKEENIVVEEIQKGYTLNEKVIRVAKVKVSK